MKINNFSAGPSKIPQIVLDQLAKDITDYHFEKYGQVHNKDFNI